MQGILDTVRTYFRARNYRRGMIARSANAETVILSYPKCGRTWHRILLGRYLAALTNSEPRAAVEVERLCELAGAKRIHYTHNGSSPTQRIPALHPLVGTPLEWEGRDVAVLVRDPRDTMLSMYYHLKYREGSFGGKISQFLRSPEFGVAKLVVAWRRWYDERGRARTFTVQSYEDMHRDPKRVLRETLGMIGLNEFDPKLADEAVRFASFGNLQSLESENYFDSGILNNESGDPRAAKVREGKIGGYRDELSEDDIAYIENAVREIGDPFGTLKA